MELVTFLTVVSSNRPHSELGFLSVLFYLCLRYYSFPHWWGVGGIGGGGWRGVHIVLLLPWSMLHEQSLKH